MFEPILGDLPSTSEPKPSPALLETGVIESNRRPLPKRDALQLPQPLPQRLLKASCPVCGATKRATGELDLNCCYSGGSWAGKCGPQGGGSRFSWPEGFRICNNLSLAEPEPDRQHAASIFMPLHTPFRRVVDGAVISGRDVVDADGDALPDVGNAAGGQREMRTYVLTLGDLAAAQRRMQGLLDATSPSTQQRPQRQAPPSGQSASKHRSAGAGIARLCGAPGAEDECRFRVTALRAVRAEEALRVAGVVPPRAEAVFGVQARRPEFLSTLGCALSHLLAARRMLLDGASVALILEEDAVADLHPLWQAPPHAYPSTMPAGWEALQLAVQASEADWGELRSAWRRARLTWGDAPLIRRDFYWSTAAYLLHARGARKLLGTYDGRSVEAGAAPGVRTPRPTMALPQADDEAERSAWQLGQRYVRCVQADTCVVYPALSAQHMYVATPPLFTCAAQNGSSIHGHDRGVQLRVHQLSRQSSFEFAREARPPSPARAASCSAPGGARLSLFLSDAGFLSIRSAGVGDRAEPRGADSPSGRLPDALEALYVRRHASRPSEVLRFRQARRDGGHCIRGDVIRFTDRSAYTLVGRWQARGSALVVRWRMEKEGQPWRHQQAASPKANAEETALGAGDDDLDECAINQQGQVSIHQPEGRQMSDVVEVYCREERFDGSHAYVLAPTAPLQQISTTTAATTSTLAGLGSTVLAPLLPPAGRMLPRANDAEGALRHLPFRFWLHDTDALWWEPLLQCTPDWDRGLDSQNAAEVWLLAQLSVHPNRTYTWQDSDVVVLPLLPKTSLHAGRCLGTNHSQRLDAAIEAMHEHPAYRRRQGHDHLALSNYWDAWGAFGDATSASHAALANVTFGWHETSAAAWGMANHRHVGRCQVALPYVESEHCAARPVAELLAAPRPASLFFSGSVAEFDTRPGATACPNVARHAKAVRQALVSVARSINHTLLRSLPHNLRSCNGSAACEDRLKASAAEDASRSQLCAVAAGDTPSTGRLYDAISCLCVPLIVTDDLQLPFSGVGALRGHAGAPPSPDAYGLRLRESVLLADPAAAVRRALLAVARGRGRRVAIAEPRQALVKARRQLAYRTPGSLVASFALHEAWMSCLQPGRSAPPQPPGVAEC